MLIRAVVVTPDAPARLALASVDVPRPTPSEALVRVAAVSLNRGEVRRAQAAPAGSPIGWDLAGTVEQAATDGSGPVVGTRVVGFLPTGAWSELAAVPTHALAALPDSVSFAQAATLPVAGLTALLALEKNGSIFGRSALITGASGGVGDFAVQIARDAGAYVVAQVRSPERVAAVRAAGAHEVVVGDDAAGAETFGPYQVIVDGVGGATLGSALALLAKGGMAVCYGATGGASVPFDVQRFYPLGSATVYGFILFHEVTLEPAGIGLARLVGRIAAGNLRPAIEVEASWSEVGTVAQRLLDRGYPGKAVLHID